MFHLRTRDNAYGSSLSALLLAASVGLSAILMFAGCTVEPASAGDPPVQVWYKSASQSPDLPTMFEKPAQWAAARQKINVFMFAPENVEPYRKDTVNLQALTSVDAFRKLNQWGLATALEVPAVKGWDCSTHQTSLVTIRDMGFVERAGGNVRYLAMDEPLVTSLISKVCPYDLDQTAAMVAKYIASVDAAPEVRAQGLPDFVDEEIYPGFTPALLEQWVMRLKAHGVTLAGLHLDVDINRIDRTPYARPRLVADFRELQTFLRDQHVPMGVIFWSGYDPLRSDKEYFDHVMAWVRLIHTAIGRPDHVIFQSWVSRCGSAGCGAPHHGCTAADPHYCGTQSMPLNLPTPREPRYSGTQLVTAGLPVLLER